MPVAPLTRGIATFGRRAGAALPQQLMEADVRQRHVVAVGVSAAVAGFVLSSPECAAGQAPTRAASAVAAADKSTAPRTPWGHPDLQGNWTNTTTTPLERPSDFAGKTALTAAERAALDAAAARRRESPVAPGGHRRLQRFLDGSRQSVRSHLAARRSSGRETACPDARGVETCGRHRRGETGPTGLVDGRQRV